MPTHSYESAYAYLTKPNFYGGMEPYDDFLRLFVALLTNEVGVPGEHLLAELAYHLNDEQRRALQQLVAAANWLDDQHLIAAALGERGLAAARAGDRRHALSLLDQASGIAELAGDTDAAEAWAERRDLVLSGAWPGADTG